MVDDGLNSGSGKAQRQLCYPRGCPKPITVDLTVDDHHVLLGGRYADRVPMADRLRALIGLCREDPAVAEAVSTRACAQELLLAASLGRAPSAAPEPPTETPDPQAPATS